MALRWKLDSAINVDKAHLKQRGATWKLPDILLETSGLQRSETFQLVIGAPLRSLHVWGYVGAHGTRSLNISPSALRHICRIGAAHGPTQISTTFCLGSASVELSVMAVVSKTGSCSNKKSPPLIAFDSHERRGSELWLAVAVSSLLTTAHK